MTRQRIWATRLLVTTTLFALPSLQHAVASGMEGDARSIQLSEVRVLDPKGRKPRLSPDGHSILYYVTGRDRHAIGEKRALWLMNVDGTNKRMLLDNAYNGAWAPDGTRITYCIWKGDGLHIYDLKSKKAVKIAEGYSNCTEANIWWLRREQFILYDAPGYGSQYQYVIDLETLERQQPPKDYYARRREWIDANALRTAHKNVWIYDDSMEPGKETFDSGRLWIQNRGDGYRRLLLKEEVRIQGWTAGLTPDLTRLIFGVVGRGVWSASITHQGIRGKIFQIPVGKTTILAPRKDRYTYGRIPEEILVEGRVLGTIYSPKVNPLNGKTVGPSEAVKGYARFTVIKDGVSLLEVTEERSSIKAGDVIANIQGTSPRRGGHQLGGVWSVLEEFHGQEDQGERR